MKTHRNIILICIFLLITCKSNAQNLVPNPSFEDTVFCPLYLSQIYAAKHWMNYGISPDYFNSCNTTGVSVPNSICGFQYAHNGNGMAGLFLRRNPNSPNGPNAREYIAVELPTYLNIGSKYYFSCFINFSFSPTAPIACNKFGMKLSTIPHDSSQYLTLVHNFAHVYSDSIVTDTVQWFKVSGSIIADSSYHYLILGNFFDDQSTDTLSYFPTNEFSYYYVDDVCLSLDSLYCNGLTSLSDDTDYNSSSIKIFPVPAFDHLIIESEESIALLKIFDAYGKVLLELSFINDLKVKLDISTFSSGIYFLKIQTMKSIYFKSFVKP